MKLIKTLFWIYALFYLAYGVLFAFFAPNFFAFTQVPPPNHWGYVHFIATTSFIFALMTFNLAKDPLKNKNLLVYIILYQLFYSVVVFVDKAIYGMPQVWVLPAISSVIFAVIFISIYAYLNCPSHTEKGE